LLEMTLDQTLGNWFHFIKLIHHIKNWLTAKSVQNWLTYFIVFLSGLCKRKSLWNQEDDGHKRFENHLYKWNPLLRLNKLQFRTQQWEKWNRKNTGERTKPEVKRRKSVLETRTILQFTIQQKENGVKLMKSGIFWMVGA
jgi:hypothetical protein